MSGLSTQAPVLEACMPLIEFTIEYAALGSDSPIKTRSQMLEFIIARWKAGIAASPHAAGIASDIVKPVMGLVDFLIERSTLPFAAEWVKDGAAKHFETEGVDEVFSRSCKDALDRSQKEVIPFYYLAMKLGYCGMFSAQEAEKMLAELQAQLNAESFPNSLRYPDLKVHPVEKEDFTMTAAEKVMPVVVVMARIGFMGFAFLLFRYADLTDDLRAILTRIAGQR